MHVIREDGAAPRNSCWRFASPRVRVHALQLLRAERNLDGKSPPPHAPPPGGGGSFEEDDDEEAGCEIAK